MNTNTVGYTEHNSALTDSLVTRFRARPAIRAAALVWILYAGLAVIDLLTLGLAIPFTFGFQLLLAGGAGALAGFLHDREGFRSGQYGKLGAVAGLFIPIFSTLALIVLGLICGLSSLGITLSGGLVAVVCLPLSL